MASYFIKLPKVSGGGGGGATWGTITGTLSSQTDLQNALNAKANDNAVVKLTGTQSVGGAKTFTEDVTVSKASGNAAVIINAPLATDAKNLTFQTAGLNRWRFRVDSANDDFTLRRYDNAGSFIDNPLEVNRGTGVVTINGSTMAAKEDVANKENTTLDTSTTKYPTNNLVKTYVDSALKSRTTIYTTTTAFTKDPNVKLYYVELCSGGGGGGSGRRGAANTNRGGGGGGASASIMRGFIHPSQVPSSGTVTIGAGGVGGAGAALDDTNGQAGGAGGFSDFCGIYRTVTAPGGGAGSTTSGGGGVGSIGSTAVSFETYAMLNGGNGGLPGAGNGAASNTLVPTPGGGGGGINTTNTTGNGGNGGQRQGLTPRLNGTAINGGSGGGGGVSGSNGSNGNTSVVYFSGVIFGTGGGGGGSGSAGVGGNGGGGAGFGSGGGGGGASTNGFISGAGGNGADGYVILVEYY